MPKGIIYDEFSKENLEKKYGVKAVTGKLSPAKGKYALTYGGKRTTLDPNQLISDQPLDKIVKAPVDVLVIRTPKGGVVIIIITHFITTNRKPPSKRVILCYKPLPNLAIRIDQDVRMAVVKKLLQEGGLPDSFNKAFEKGLNAGNMR